MSLGRGLFYSFIASSLFCIIQESMETDFENSVEDASHLNLCVRTIVRFAVAVLSRQLAVTYFLHDSFYSSL
jgi:hypothetical protein